MKARGLQAVMVAVLMLVLLCAGIGFVRKVQGCLERAAERIGCNGGGADA